MHNFTTSITATAELATAMPQNGGYIVWVARAFGNFGGYLEGYFTCVSALFDNAVYPVLFANYLEAVVTTSDLASASPTQRFAPWSPLARIGVRIILVAIVTFVNLRGAKVVGVASIALGVIVILPFIVMFLAATGDGMISPAQWFDYSGGGANGMSGDGAAVSTSAASASATHADATSAKSFENVHWGILLSVVLWSNCGWDTPVGGATAAP
jgi:amino acid transporter